MNTRAISIDFWDTLIVRTLDAQKLRLLVCRKLVKDFSLEISAEGLLKLQNEMGRGLSTIAHDLGYDREYILENSWFLIGATLLFDENLSSIFATTAIETELILTKKFSKKNRILHRILTYLETSSSITLISDFEGSALFLEKILAHHGIEKKYDILISSAVLYRKSTGNLFKIYLDQIRHDYTTKSVHFGDNFYSDYRQPKKLSIKSIWLPKLKFSSKIYMKLLRKVFSIRLRTFSYKSDLNIASKIISNFIYELTEIAKLSKKVYYIGSEGAFLSKFAWDKLPNEQICLNFGRKNVLEALASTKIHYVLSKMILENSNIPELINFFKLNDKVSSERFFRQLIFSPQAIDYEYLRECLRENSSRSLNFLERLNLEEGDLFVDIGYKGTFIRALTLYSNKEFRYLQLFGNRIECMDFAHKWRSIYQSEDRSCFSYFRINTRMVEILFSDGPRAPIKNSKIDNFVNSLNISKSGPVKNFTLHRFFNSPSLRLTSGMKFVTHEDELKNITIKNRFFDTGKSEVE